MYTTTGTWDPCRFGKSKNEIASFRGSSHRVRQPFCKKKRNRRIRRVVYVCAYRFYMHSSSLLYTTSDSTINHRNYLLQRLQRNDIKHGNEERRQDHELSHAFAHTYHNKIVIMNTLSAFIIWYALPEPRIPSQRKYAPLHAILVPGNWD